MTKNHYIEAIGFYFCDGVDDNLKLSWFFKDVWWSYKPELQINDFVEEESSPGCSCEPRRDQLASIRQKSSTLKARKNSRTSEILQINSSHVGYWDV